MPVHEISDDSLLSARESNDDIPITIPVHATDPGVHLPVADHLDHLLPRSARGPSGGGGEVVLQRVGHNVHSSVVRRVECDV